MLTFRRPRFHSLCKDLLTRLLKPLREVSLMAGVNLPGESGQVGLTSEMSLVADGSDSEDSDYSPRVEDGGRCMRPVLKYHIKMASK